MSQLLLKSFHCFSLLLGFTNENTKVLHILPLFLWSHLSLVSSLHPTPSLRIPSTFTFSVSHRRMLSPATKILNLLVSPIKMFSSICLTASYIISQPRLLSQGKLPTVTDDADPYYTLS